jgi:hypothetical protein
VVTGAIVGHREADMIPPERLDPQAQQMLVEWLVKEINRALGERRVLEEQWMRYHKVYKALPEHEVKTFPFQGASNLVIPVAATDVDVIFARLMGILFAPDNLMSCRPKKPEMIEFARVLQEFLQAVQESELKAFDVCADFVLEVVKLGTGILKTRYKREHKEVYEFREIGGQVFEDHRTVRMFDHAELAHVSLFDFLVPATAQDIQSSPWVAERVLLTWPQYLNRVREGIYIPAPQLENWQAQSRGSNVLEHLMELDKYKAGVGDKLEFWECWTNFDIEGTGSPRALVCTIHIPTWSVVRLDFNPYLKQEYPYERARFLRQEKRFYGIGMIEMLDQFQDEVTAMHNQRIDSGTLANSTMFKGRRGVVREDEPIFPGRWFLLDDMNDVDVLNMGAGKLDTSANYEGVTMQYAKHRSGVNEHVAGQFAPSIGYATAHTNLQQLQQATQRFDQTLREIRKALSGSIVRAVELYQQFDREGRAFTVLGERDGMILQHFIEFPIEDIREGVAIDVTATSASLNKEVEIRTNTILMQMVSQFYREMLDGLMLAFTPGLPPQLQTVIFQMIQGGTILMRRILAAHGVQDSDDLVPHIEDILSGQLPIGQLVSEPFRRGAAGFGGIGAGAGMAGPPQIGGQSPNGAGVGTGVGADMGAGLPFAGGNDIF